jgi:hypothetical protein
VRDGVALQVVLPRSPCKYAPHIPIVLGHHEPKFYRPVSAPSQVQIPHRRGTSAHDVATESRAPVLMPHNVCRNVFSVRCHVSNGALSPNARGGKGYCSSQTVCSAIGGLTAGFAGVGRVECVDADKALGQKQLAL